MIIHVSIPADDCQAVARVLAEIMEGTVVRFPPGGPNAWTAWSKDEQTQIVVTQRGHYLIPGETEADLLVQPAVRAAESHLALCVARPAAELLDIARRAGWPARLCDRGGFFSVVETWVEGAYLLELLDPGQTAAYQHSMTLENWRAHFPD